MKRQGLSQLGRNGLAVGIVGLSLAYAAQGGVPLNNLQGVGGVAFNPLAYPAGQNKGSNSWEQVENANYWDVSLAWLATKNLTLAVAYVDTGKNQASPFGLGNGTVLSAQYAF